ncbi:MAG: sigma-70 family RNA polymerase sigma factor [Bryobacteraceae bacterium]|nr:sigma-70 family RNA polymerase sigma factor [Bryobacteraceae bacterium]
MLLTISGETFDHWAELVGRIRGGDAASVEELYRYFARGVRLLISRQLGTEHLDDRVHDVFLMVLEAIREGRLREPERLPGFIRTVVRRQTASMIADSAGERRNLLDIGEHSGLAAGGRDPEQSLLQTERVQLVRRTLSEMSSRDREILTRFYLYEQKPGQICEEMGLNETQFRLLKSRAKARFGESERRAIQNRGTGQNFVRKTAGA